MGFSYQQQRFTPEELNPMSHLVSNALKNYKALVGAKYAEKEKDADIIGKSLTPLANIATSPLGNAFLPEQQDQLRAYISSIIPRQQGQQNAQAQPGMMDKLKQFLHMQQQGNTPMGQSGMQQQGSTPMGQSGTQPGMPQQGMVDENGQAPSTRTPSQNEVRQGAINQATAKYTEAPHGENARLTENGQIKALTPTAEQISKASDFTITEKNLDKSLDTYTQMQKNLLSNRVATEAGKIHARLYNAMPKGLKGDFESYADKLGAPSRDLAAQAAAVKKMEGPLVEQLKKYMPAEDARKLIKPEGYESGDAFSKNMELVRSIIHTQGQTQRGAVRNDIPLDEQGTVLPNGDVRTPDGQILKSHDNQVLEPMQEQQDADLQKSKDWSQEIKKELGVDIPETFIFNYMSEHKGNIDVKKLLKAAGIKR